MHSSAFSDLNQIAAEQNEKVLQCDSTCKQDKKNPPPHRFFTGCPRSERKYFTAVQLPAGLRFIILYLIPFISSTFSRVIRLPVLHICLQPQIKEVTQATRSGFLLKQVYLVIAGIQTDRKVVFGAGEQAPD